jgi:hypothetical protein
MDIFNLGDLSHPISNRFNLNPTPLTPHTASYHPNNSFQRARFSPPLPLPSHRPALGPSLNCPIVQHASATVHEIPPHPQKLTFPAFSGSEIPYSHHGPNVVYWTPLPQFHWAGNCTGSSYRQPVVAFHRAARES